MPRADLLRQLFRAYKNSDRERFMDAARAIADEERRKNHHILASELLRILNNGVTAASPSLVPVVMAPPRDDERKTPLIEVRYPDRYLRDVVLESRALDLIRRVIHEFKEWDVLESNGLRPSHRMLFCGPPGCGKTMTAEAIAGEMGLPLLYVRFDSVVSSLLGETASNIRKVFDYASQDNWVVLFDEFDAIGRSRDDITEHGEIKRVVNSFLQMLDNFAGQSLIIAATNFEQVLDPALWRRFDEIVRFERPTPQQTKELMKRRLQASAHGSAMVGGHLDELRGASFADVDRICLDVLKTLALEGRRKLLPQDLVSALGRHESRMQVMERALQANIPRVDQA